MVKSSHKLLPNKNVVQPKASYDKMVKSNYETFSNNNMIDSDYKASYEKWYDWIQDKVSPNTYKVEPNHKSLYNDDVIKFNHEVSVDKDIV